MTRTERNQYPAAILKDRRSRSGLNQPSETQRKHGAGAHNWGSFQQEGELEFAADQDAAQETEDNLFDMEGNGPALPAQPQLNGHQQGGDQETDEGVIVNKDIAKDVISTSPTDSMSSLDSAGGRNPGIQRRMSNVTDEERERARVYREGGMKQNGIDLAHIARTSYGIAQSPPNGGGILATSPIKSKGGFTKQ